MGKKLIIIGADFSQNAIVKENMITGFLNGFYNTTSGVFLPEGSDFQGTPVSGWRASNKVEVLAGDSVRIIVVNACRVVVFSTNQSVSSSQILGEGEHFLDISENGFVAINLRLDVSHPSSTTIESSTLEEIDESKIYID